MLIDDNTPEYLDILSGDLFQRVMAGTKGGD